MEELWQTLGDSALALPNPSVIFFDKQKNRLQHDAGLLALAAAKLWQNLGASALALANPNIFFFAKKKKYLCQNARLLAFATAKYVPIGLYCKALSNLGRLCCGFGKH